jgi:endonuclease/exonuclease/phosphatase family metal-dependent hydrolase
MKLATFNIYWLGDPQRDVRQPHHTSRLAEIIAVLDADVYVFQEIVRPNALRGILNMAQQQTPASSARRYEIEDGAGNLLGDAGSGGQKVVIAYDAEHYDLLSNSAIRGGVSRAPYGVRLQRKDDGSELTVVGLHLQSGYPDLPDVSDSNKRAAQCRHVAAWVKGDMDQQNPQFPGPSEDEYVVILGDFNAVYDHQDANHPLIVGQGDFDRFVASLDPLREDHMADWQWEKPVPQSPADGQVSVYAEHLLIDFIIFSPSLAGRVTRPPTIYAFDRTGLAGQQVSDHRPVFAELNV